MATYNIFVFVLEHGSGLIERAAKVVHDKAGGVRYVQFCTTRDVVRGSIEFMRALRATGVKALLERHAGCKVASIEGVRARDRTTRYMLLRDGCINSDVHGMEIPAATGVERGTEDVVATMAAVLKHTTVPAARSGVLASAPWVRMLEDAQRGALCVLPDGSTRYEFVLPRPDAVTGLTLSWDDDADLSGMDVCLQLLRDDALPLLPLVNISHDVAAADRVPCGRAITATSLRWDMEHAPLPLICLNFTAVTLVVTMPPRPHGALPQFAIAIETMAVECEERSRIIHSTIGKPSMWGGRIIKDGLLSTYADCDLDAAYFRTIEPPPWSITMLMWGSVYPYPRHPAPTDARVMLQLAFAADDASGEAQDAVVAALQGAEPMRTSVQVVVRRTKVMLRGTVRDMAAIPSLVSGFPPATSRMLRALCGVTLQLDDGAFIA